MIKINLLCVGTLKEKYWREAVEEYKKRLTRYCDFKVLETEERRTTVEEGKELLQKARGVKIAFDIGGKLVDSEGFAKGIADLSSAGKSEFTFIIGGSEGLSEEVKGACDMRISFGRVTYPHQLMRVIAAEQIYRAMTILNGVKYHK